MISKQKYLGQVYWVLFLQNMKKKQSRVYIATSHTSSQGRPNGILASHSQEVMGKFLTVYEKTEKKTKPLSFNKKIFKIISR